MLISDTTEMMLWNIHGYVLKDSESSALFSVGLLTHGKANCQVIKILKKT